MPLNVDHNLPFSDENPRLTRFEHFQSGFCEQVCCARAQASPPGLARSVLLMTMMIREAFKNYLADFVRQGGAKK